MQSRRTFDRNLILSVLICAPLWLVSGCQAPKPAPTRQVAHGQFAEARTVLEDQMTDDRNDRHYLLDRMRLGIVMLDDNDPVAAQTVFEDVYEVLRTQGINADKTVQAVVINEDVKFWKGEPFEQALAYLYYSFQQAELGQWDNTRAAAGNALFNLRDFGEDESSHRLDVEAIAKRAMIYERAQAQGKDPAEALRDSDYLNTGYALRESNFTLGYLINGLANQQLGRTDEANDNYAVASQIRPDIEPLVALLRSGDYNTVLVVTYGLGPRKVAFGPDRALAQFEPRYPSDDRPLLVQRQSGQTTIEHAAFPIVCDVNEMAHDHMWNSLEDVRLAKSAIGDGLIFGGAVSTGYGIDQDNDAALWAGLGAMAAGMLAKDGAHANTRYCELFPQRIYFAPIWADRPDTEVSIMIEGDPATRMILRNLKPPQHGIRLHYVRLFHM